MSNNFSFNAQFEEDVSRILKAEGTRSNHKSDRGGLTKFGISERAHPAVALDDFSRQDAKIIYHNSYYVPMRLHCIDRRKLRVFLFQLAVNVGVTRAVTMLQEVLRDVGQQQHVDGIMGNQTLISLLNHLENGPKQIFYPSAEEELVSRLAAKQENHYETLAENDPSQRAFLDGWKNRVSEFS